MTIDEIVSILRTAVRYNDIKNEYARAYIEAFDRCNSNHEKRTQLLYVMANLEYWRGNTARETKLMIKNWLKENA